MAHYLVKAQYQKDLLAELRTRLDSSEINKMRPFETALQYSLDHARLDPRSRLGCVGSRGLLQSAACAGTRRYIGYLLHIPER